MNFASDGVHSLRSAEHNTQLYSKPVQSGTNNYLWMDQTGKLEAESTPIGIYNRLNANYGIVGIDSIRLKDYGPSKFFGKYSSTENFDDFFQFFSPLNEISENDLDNKIIVSQSGHGQIRHSFTRWKSSGHRTGHAQSDCILSRANVISFISE